MHNTDVMDIKHEHFTESLYTSEECLKTAGLNVTISCWMMVVNSRDISPRDVAWYAAHASSWHGAITVVRGWAWQKWVGVIYRIVSSSVNRNQANELSSLNIFSIKIFKASEISTLLNVLRPQAFCPFFVWMIGPKLKILVRHLAIFFLLAVASNLNF